MKFLFLNIILLIVGGVLLIYLAGSAYFSPWTETGGVDTGNVALFIVLIAIIAGLVVSLLVFLGEKLISYGRNEFPSATRAVKASLIVTILLAVLLMLHVFHFLSLPLGLVVCGLVIIGIMFVT